MARTCLCNQRHDRRRVVLTGGPGAGKTALLELVRQSFCAHVKVLPEAAGIVFGGGFPRGPGIPLRQAEQRAIFHVQRELEAAADGEDAALVLCDRGTVDGGAYWPEPGDLWSSVGTTLAGELARYDAVIHLRTPAASNGYDHSNPLRVESAAEASAIDDRIARLWSGHPRLFTIEATPNFLGKAARALDILRAEVPRCCQVHIGTIVPPPAARPEVANRDRRLIALG
jgi:predicted ATPase